MLLSDTSIKRLGKVSTMIICSILLPQFIMGQTTCIDSATEFLKEPGISGYEMSTFNLPFILTNKKSTMSGHSNIAKILKDNLLIKPSGSIRISGNFNHDPNQFYPLAIGIEGNISQSILSIPMQMETEINSYNTDGIMRQGNFSIAFNRTLFLEGIKSMLLQQQKEQFKMIFDSIKVIETNFGAFDSIAQLLNNRQNLFEVQEAYQTMNNAIQYSEDSCIEDDLRVDASVIVAAQEVIDKHLALEQAYGRLLAYKTDITNRFKTLDLRKIISSFDLPLTPDQLPEAQLIAEAKANGMNNLNEFLSGLKTFTIGQVWLHQSPTTIYNKRANGLSFIYEVQGIYLGGTLAREMMNKLPYTGSGSNIQIAGSPKQFNVISQGLLGSGSREKQFVEVSLTSFNASDHSVIPSITAFHNCLVSVSAGIFRTGGFCGLAEITGSKYAFSKSGLPTETPSTGNAGQHIAYHFQLKEQLPVLGFAADIDFVSTGLFYKTYGNSYLPADARTIKSNISQHIIGHKLILSMRMDLRQYNVSSCFQLPFFQLNYSGDLRWNYRGGNMIITYNPIISTSKAINSAHKLLQLQLQIFQNYSISNHAASGSINIYAISNQVTALPDSMSISSPSFLRGDFQQQVSISSKFLLGTVFSLQGQQGTSAISNYRISVTGNLKAGTKSDFMLGFQMVGFTEIKYYGGSLTMRWNILKNVTIHYFGDVNLNLQSGNVMKTGIFHSSISYVQTF